MSEAQPYLAKQVLMQSVSEAVGSPMTR